LNFPKRQIDDSLARQKKQIRGRSFISSTLETNRRSPNQECIDHSLENRDISESFSHIKLSDLIEITSGIAPICQSDKAVANPYLINPGV
jgi:hypothetical protein